MTVVRSGVGSRRRAAEYLSAGVVAAVTFLVFLPALKNGFVNWEDNRYVYDNPQILRIGPAFFKWVLFGSHDIMWHPLTWLSHALDYFLWRMRPAGHHLTSILLHAANTFLVCVLSARLLKSGSTERQGARWPDIFTILVTGLLFGLHPLHVESVAWVAERKDVLSAFFFLLALLGYLRFLEGRGPGPRPESVRHSRRGYVAALVFFTLALLSKPMAITLPIVVLVLDWYRDRFGNREMVKAVLVEKLPFFALSFLAVTVTLKDSNVGSGLSTVGDAPLSKVLVGLHGLVFYLVKMAWPGDLSPLYLYPQDVSLASPRYLVPAVAVVALTALSLAFAKRWRAFPALWGAYIAMLLPVLGIVPVGPHAVADRYAYLPSIGPFLLAGLGGAWGLRKTATGRSRPGYGGAAILIGSATCIAFLAVKTVGQIAVWKDSKTFWRYVIEREPRAYIGYNNLGNIYFIEDNVSEALRYYRKASELRVDATLLNNLAICFVRMDRLGYALEYATMAVKADPRNGGMFNTLGKVFLRTREYEKALGAFQQGLAVDPDRPVQNLYSIAYALENLGRYGEACRYWARYLEVGREDQDFAETLQHYREAGCAETGR